MIAVRVENFSEWRETARTLFLKGLAPREVEWMEPEQQTLLSMDLQNEVLDSVKAPQFSVPKAFVELAQTVALVRDHNKWALLYRSLWRVLTENPNLLQMSTDEDVRKLHGLAGEVRRDCHKMKAFVRFRQTQQENTFLAWHEPSHLIVQRVAPFFARRFEAMNWGILTPDRSAFWDQKSLRFGPGQTRRQAPTGDELEDLWKTYYRHTFNPARIKIQAMCSEMPKKYWHTMPETALISELLQEAPSRVETMIARAQSRTQTPQEMIEEMIENLDQRNLESLKNLAAGCQGCDLCHSATQTVFGTGNPRARLMIVGEQPGDREDREGQPFVGPAGKLLRSCLAATGLSSQDAYFTNTVKHFRWQPAPYDKKKRIHKRATWRQISTCKPWLEAEIEAVQPELILCLGATASQALLGKEFSITQQRGQVFETQGQKLLCSVHPSSLLRIEDQPRKELEIERFRQDLNKARMFLESSHERTQATP